MTSDSDEPAPKPKRRPRRTQAEIFYEDYKREEAEWNPTPIRPKRRTL
jgi:hypothetical protein